MDWLGAGWEWFGEDCAWGESEPLGSASVGSDWI